ncbi:MAG TPA: hypothetical protein ENJ09_09535 [Planctomycetes bacterium]|nr:hypothetical protein [Planctomycetota bacterium]
MTPPSESPKKKATKKPKVRTRTPRPDELTQETFEFIAAIDEYKREHMRSFLDDSEVLEILHELGYRLGDEEVPEGVTEAQLDAFAQARERYRVEEGRLFPTWSEVFELLTQLGYHRSDRAA